MMSRVINAILTHQSPEEVDKMLAHWSAVVPRDSLWILYGGTRENFDQLSCERKLFVDDPRLRTKDHQRERQSYQGVFKILTDAIEGLAYDYLFFTEFDQIPLVEDLNDRLIERIKEEEADALFNRLIRVDETSHPHFLSHASDPAFYEFFDSFSVREDRAVLSAYGFGQFWRREALEAVLRHPDGVNGAPRIYLELWAPTVAHHLGYRLRGLSDQVPFNHFKVGPAENPLAMKELGAWLAHPYKDFWK